MSNLIELNNIRVLSTTYEKLMITINEEQMEILKSIDMPYKTVENEEYGISYTTVVKVVSDKMCALYKSIPRDEITKGCYDIVVMKSEWLWQGKSGVRLDAYFIRKLEPVIKVNPELLRLINPTPTPTPTLKTKSKK